MMRIDPQTGYAEASGRSPRFNLWAAFFVFSIITLGSAVQVKRSVEEGLPVPATTKYAVACSAVTFAITAVVVIIHFFSTTAILFVGTLVEGTICVVLVAFWTAIVSIVTDASNGLFTAEDPSGGVQNANLYYFSWAGFFTIMFITIEYTKTVFGVDAAGTIRNRAPRLLLWSGLLCTALIVMGSSARIIKKECNNDGSFKTEQLAYCKRTKLGVSTGTLSVVSAIGIILSKVILYGAPIIIESVVALFLTILNTFGVAYITSASGPGSVVGNLYYFSWGSFLLSAILAANCIGEFSGISTDPTIPTDGTTTQEQPKIDNNGDIEVETFEDNL